MYSLNIDFAQQLLSNNSLNISEVAYQIGFNDPRYFSKCFKKEAGISPKEYRNTLKRDSFSYGEKHNDEAFLQKAIVLLETKIYNENISLDEFANEMNVSKATLYRRLKSVSGLSPTELIRSLKISRSAMLLSKRKNVTDVAFAAGFNDSKYFSKCFKDAVGVSPKEYRNSFRNSSFSFGNTINDEAFLQKANVMIETKIIDKNISLDEFAYEMNVSKASLHRKIKCTSGLSPVRLIRSVKLNYSVEFLTKNRHISDIASAVGFNDYKYFSRCFKSEFGISPKQYKKGLNLQLA